MKKNLLRTGGQAVSLLLTAALLSGCAVLLERSYSVTEPYADRYWDSSAEDTLRVDTYQDLVNAITLLVTERAEEGVIRCSGEVGEYYMVVAARDEVRRETPEGSYLLRDLSLSQESGANYNTVTCRMTYREDAEDIDSMMSLSDSQSLVDLLRLAVREEHEKLTVRFSYDTPREDVSGAVESLWQELCRAEMEEAEAEASGELLPEDAPAENSAALEDPQEAGQPEETEPAGEEPPAAPDGQKDVPGEEPAGEEAPEEPPEETIVYPPCPWQVKFYPNQASADIVEVLLK